MLRRIHVSWLVVAALMVTMLTAGNYASAQRATELASDFGTENGPVVRLYVAALDRRPDFSGLEYWRGIHTDGRDLNEIAGYFVRSQEFQEKYGDLDDEDFVSLVYLNVLGRDPDAPGLDYWTGLLADGFRRGMILNGFAQSAEFVELLNRPPEPPELPEPGSDGSTTPPLLLIGDSIFHGIRILDIAVGDAEVTWMTKEGRQASTLPSLLDEAIADGSVDAVRTVVIHLGTNGWDSEWEQMFHDQMARLGQERVYLVNTEADRPWETTTNEALARIASSHTHVELVDWNAEVEPNPDWLRPDGVHPTVSGLEALANLVARTVTAS